MLSALALATTLGFLQPSPGFERLTGFDTLVINHVDAALGTENLPGAMGVPVEPGMLVTISLERMDVFDRRAAQLQGGRLVDTTIAAQCRSGCPAVLFDAFSEAWLEHAVEASKLAVEMPVRVLFAVHDQLPAATLVDAAYAVSETRPVAPPALSILVNSDRAGLRAVPFHLLPPTGLELRPGSAALGLTVHVAQGRTTVESADARGTNRVEITDAKELARHVRELGRRFPGKEVVILVPDAQVTVHELLKVAGVFAPHFARIVLSKGQELIIP